MKTLQVRSLINLVDIPAVHKARKTYFHEQSVRAEEIIVLRDKLKWCYRREGVNHFKNCRELAQQNMDILGEMKNGYFKPLRWKPDSS